MPKIYQPKNTKIKFDGGLAELKFDTKFQQKFQGKFDAAQKHIDSEVLRLSEPYTPLLTGTLIKSGSLGTKIGEGVVSWIAPYSRKQYYSPRKVGSQTGPLRGPFWFERMKASHKDQIINGAKKIISENDNKSE